MSGNSDLDGVRVAVIENDAILREAYVGLLREAGAVVVADVVGVPEYDAVCRDDRPDVVLVDIHLGDSRDLRNVDGLRLATRLRAEHDDVGVVVVTTSDQPAYLVRLLEVGDRGVGYLVKERTSRAEFVAAVAAVRDGHNKLDDRVFRNSLKLQKKARALTDEQVEILKLVAEGLKNKAIAHRLHLSEPVVERRIRDIFECLDIDRSATSEINSRVTAVVRYLRDLQEYYETQDI